MARPPAIVLAVALLQRQNRRMLLRWLNRGMNLKPQPKRPSWHRVLIPASDIAKMGPGGLMDNFAQAYRVAGAPPGVEVYQHEIDGAQLFYFSPQASAVAAHVLEQFGARRCMGEPDVSGYRRVQV